MQDCEYGIIIINIENVEILCIRFPFSSSYPLTPSFAFFLNNLFQKPLGKVGTVGLGLTRGCGEVWL